MGIYLNPGNDEYKKAVNSEIYVDKTGLIAFTNRKLNTESAFMIYEDGLYKVQVGAFRYLSNAIKMERRLRCFRYSTFIVYN